MATSSMGVSPETSRRRRLVSMGRKQVAVVTVVWRATETTDWAEVVVVE